MCFSPTASFIAGTALSAIGIATIKQVRVGAAARITGERERAF